MPTENKENKADRFRRLVEARVNKLIKTVRLLGNCSNQHVYEYHPAQVDQIFAALRNEIDAAQARFSEHDNCRAKRFSLSDTEHNQYTQRNLLLRPGVSLEMPDGNILRAVTNTDSRYPAINVYTVNRDGTVYEEICFVEYNPDKESGHELCVGVYQSDEDDTTYYESYVPKQKQE